MSITLTRRRFLTAAGALAAAACAPSETPAPSASQLSEAEQIQPVKLGYLPITDASALLVAHANGYYADEGLSAEPTLFRGWSQIAEAFQARQVNVVHLLMPMTVWMRYGLGFPLKVVAWAHMAGSALTVSQKIRTFNDLRGKTVAIPFYYSIHNVVLQIAVRKFGLDVALPGANPSPEAVRLVVMAPPDMPTALSTGAIDGYIVAEPFNAAGETLAGGRILRFTADVWKDHACCVVVMHEEDVQARPAWTRKVLNAVVKAQKWTRENTAEAARLISKDGNGYLGSAAPVVTRAMTHYPIEEYGPTGAIKHPDWNQKRLAFQPYPYPSYTAELVRRLKTTTVDGERAFLDKLDPEFVAQDLVNEKAVRAAYESAGGPAAFGIDPAKAFTREEIIDV
ncbi:MAG TPA: ABC transporter substrate-binding protein [Candidatus Limnocylindria bacterium]|jgi:NitT/TauT family transport system substrate-binding protein|nr:ABC transporter substrate-binding protein [Candidatus Limnocylindria bacterium]